MSERMRRVDELLREVISESVAELSDPGLGFVTVTGVRTSPDLRLATVFISVLGSESDREPAFAALQRARVSIQQRINRESRMKRTPVLRFEYDQSVESGARLSKLLEELEPEAHDEPDE